MKPNSKVKTYHLAEQTCKQIDILADESGESATAIVEQAVNYLYQKDTVPENLILGRISVIEMQLDKSNKEKKLFSLWQDLLFLISSPLFQTCLKQKNQ